jgi:DNA-binding GntR family transcriptional regulator
MPKPEKTYETIKALIRDIEAGEFGKQGIIPPREKLRKQYDVGADTINRVMLFLRAAGYVAPSGKQLAPTPDRLLVPGLTASFDGFLEENGRTPEYRNVGGIDVLELEANIARLFRLEPGTKAIKRTRLQGEARKNEPNKPYWYRIAETYYLYDLAAEWLQTMKDQPRFNVIKAIAAKTGQKITHAHSEIMIRFPNEKEQELLEITYDTPVGEHLRMCYAPAPENQLIMFNRLVAKAHTVSYVIEDYPIEL